jgi:AcrR family transcriptional regulator
MPNDAGHGAETDPTTQRILDAALHCFAANGVRKTTMNAIADEAGVGVATVYRRFPQKPQLIQSVLMREAARMVEGVDKAIANVTTHEEELSLGFVAFARELSERHLLREMAEDTVASEALAALAQGSTILGIGRMYLADLIRRWQKAGDIPDFDADMVAEIFARLAHSLAMIPDGVIPLEDPDKARAFARRYLLPLTNPLPE